MALRKSITEQEFTSLINIPQSGEELIRIYSLSDDDIIFIKASCRGKTNHIRVSVLLSYMKFPGIIIPTVFIPDERILDLLCNQLEIDKSHWKDYDNLAETRQDHINILRKNYGYENFSSTYYTDSLFNLTKFTLQTDKGILIAQQLVKFLRDAKILIPRISVVQKICSEALINAEKQIHDTLSSVLSNHQKQLLDTLLNLQEKSSISQLNWLKQSPQAVNSKFLLMHIKRLKTIKDIDLPKDIGKDIHQTRLLKIAREGRQMTPQHLRDFEESRRYATLVAILLETKASIIDEIIEMNDKIIGSLFRYAKNTQAQKMQESGKSMGEQLGVFFKIGY